MSKLFATMSQIDISKMTERKNGFTYLSWAHAYRLLRQYCPEAEVIKSVFSMPDGRRLPYMVDEAGYAYVQVTVIIDSYTCVEIMPVLNHANRPVQNPDSFAVNASLQRCMAKAISMITGLGIHLYCGEDTAAISASAPQAPQPVKKLDTSTLVSLEAQLENCADLQSLKQLYNSRLDWTKEQTGLFSARKKELM